MPNAWSKAGFAVIYFQMPGVLFPIPRLFPGRSKDKPTLRYLSGLLSDVDDALNKAVRCHSPETEPIEEFARILLSPSAKSCNVSHLRPRDASNLPWW